MKVLALDPNGEEAPSDVKAALDESPAVGVLLVDTVSESLAQTLASKIADSRVELMACWGVGSEDFHDLVDRERLNRQYDRHFITTWESGPLDDFIWIFRYPYLGLITFERQTEEKLLIVLSKNAAFVAEVKRLSAKT